MSKPAPWTIPLDIGEGVILGSVIFVLGLTAAGLATETNDPFKAAVEITAPDKSHGSGFFVDATHIVTADHVVSDQPGGTTFTILFEDGTTATAKVVDEDQEGDVAVLVSSKPSKDYAEIAENPAARGEDISTIGYPGSNPLTQTWGKVAYVAPDEDGLDMTIMPGNSGGPVYDLNTQAVIGIVDSESVAPVAVWTMESPIEPPVQLYQLLPFPVGHTVNASVILADFKLWGLQI